MKIAIVHDYLREYGGAERVLEAVHEMWPTAPLYMSFVDWGNLGDQGYRFKNWDIRTSWVQNNWLVKKYISPLRFLAPKIWESFDLSDYDVVISSSGWFMCRGVNAGNGLGRLARHASFAHPPSPGIFSPETSLMKGDDGAQIRVPHRALSSESKQCPLHICYIHHPPRNLYGYATGSDLQKYWPVRVYAVIVNFYLRHYDFETAQRVDFFIANSKETARRVEKFYRRESTVIYPPVEMPNAKWRMPNNPIQHSTFNIQHSYFLSVGRLTYSKRVDLAIEACNKLKLPLKVVGTGKEEAYLRSIAHDNVEFVGAVSDSELATLYAGARALIFCALDEDFGMVPVEAMAQGVPVIALGQGGVLETIVDGKTGILFHEPTVESVVGGIKRLEDSKTVRWKENCRKQAEKFSKERFQKELKSFVESHIGK